MKDERERKGIFKCLSLILSFLARESLLPQVSVSYRETSIKVQTPSGPIKIQKELPNDLGSGHSRDSLRKQTQAGCESSLVSGELVLGLFLLALNLELGLLLIELHELGEIELGLLEELDLADEDVLEGEDLLALLYDLLAKRILDAI